MLNLNKLRFCLYGLLLFVFILGGVDALAQEKDKDKEYKYKNKTYSKEFCSNNWSNGDKVSGKRFARNDVERRKFDG